MRLNADIIYHNLKQLLDVKIYGMFKGVEFRTVKDESRDMPVMNAEYVVRQ